MIARPGEELPIQTFVVKPAAMQLWSEILNDPNPIHLDVAVVRAKGLGDRLINQGPANTAYVITALQNALPDFRLEALRVRFIDNVFAGETVAASGIIRTVEQTARGVRLACAVALHAGSRAVLGGEADLIA